MRKKSTNMMNGLSINSSISWTKLLQTVYLVHLFEILMLLVKLATEFADISHWQGFFKLTILYPFLKSMHKASNRSVLTAVPETPCKSVMLVLSWCSKLKPSTRGVKEVWRATLPSGHRKHFTRDMPRKYSMWQLNISYILSSTANDAEIQWK